MNKAQAIETAKEQMNYMGADGFVVIKYIDKTPYKAFIANGYECDCDFETFDTFDELKKFINGQTAYNSLDFVTYLRDGEKVVYAYSKSKLIIL